MRLSERLDNIFGEPFRERWFLALCVCCIIVLVTLVSNLNRRVTALEEKLGVTPDRWRAQR